LYLDITALEWIVKNDHPEARPILESFYDATVRQQAKRGRLYLEIVDENGNKLSNVKATVRGVWGGAIRREPNVSSEETRIDGETKIPWLPPSFSIEVDLRKEGYRKVGIAFTKLDSAYATEIYCDARKALCEGYVYPPKTPDGPVRVVMPAAVVWDPPVHNDGGRLAVAGDYRPKRIRGDELVIASTDAPKIVLAPVRGTYVIADKDGMVVNAYRADKDHPIGFWKFKYTRDPEDRAWFSHLAISGQWCGARDGEPYTRRLYSEAKPIPLPPEPMTPSAPKPAKGAVVADE
jgi:hypothetical protein